VHAHDEDEVGAVEVRRQARDVGLGVEGDARLGAGLPDRVERASRVARGLDVHGDIGGTGLDVLRDPVLGPFDHEMDVERSPVAFRRSATIFGRM